MPAGHLSTVERRLQLVLALRRQRVADNPAAMQELLKLVDVVGAELAAAPDRAAAHDVLSKHQHVFQQLALQLGFDPRPSALTDWLLWGPEMMRREIQPVRLTSAVARVNPSSHPALCRRATAAGLGAWRILEPTDRSLADLAVEKISAVSTDGGVKWVQVLDDAADGPSRALRARYLAEVDLRTLVSLKRLAPIEAVLEDGTVVPIPRSVEEMEQLRQQAVKRIGKGAREHFLRWLDREPARTPYLVKLVVSHSPAAPAEAPLGAWLPDVIDLPGAAGLAKVTPDALVIELTGKDINWLKDGFSSARVPPGDDEHARHIAAEALSSALARDAVTETREFLLLGSLLRQDVDWIWREVARRRRTRGQPTARPPAAAKVKLAGRGDMLSRRQARAYWLGLAGGPGCRLDEDTRVEVWNESDAVYPWLLECGACKTWWLHGCAHCRTATSSPACNRPRRCPTPGCGKRLTAACGSGEGASSEFIASEIRKHLDSMRKSGPKNQNS